MPQVQPDLENRVYVHSIFTAEHGTVINGWGRSVNTLRVSSVPVFSVSILQCVRPPDRILWRWTQMLPADRYEYISCNKPRENIGVR